MHTAFMVFAPAIIACNGDVAKEDEVLDDERYGMAHEVYTILSSELERRNQQDIREFFHALHRYHAQHSEAGPGHAASPRPSPSPHHSPSPLPTTPR